MSDVLQFTCESNRLHAPVLETPQLIYLYSEIRPGIGISNVRLPLNFALVLDRSGSMAGEKLFNVKGAVKMIVDQLNPADVISIVTFETKTQLLVPAQPVNNKDDIKRKIDRIDDGGGTNMAAGLREGISQVSAYNDASRISRILLLTDGEATDDENDSRREADQAGYMGVPIFGLGFGDKWNENFIIDLTDRAIQAAPGSNAGNAYYIQNPGQVASIFQQVFQSMQIVAQNVSMTIRTVQGLETRRVWQVVPMIKDIGLNVIQGRAVVVPVGDLEQGGAAFLIEMMLPPRQPGAFRIAQADVKYFVPNRGERRDTVDIVVQFTYDPNLANQMNGKVMNIVEKVQAFKLQTQALSEAEVGNVDIATRKLRQAVTILLSQGETELASQMQGEADQLEQSGQISSEGKKTIKLTSRKTVRLSE